MPKLTSASTLPPVTLNSGALRAIAPRQKRVIDTGIGDLSSKLFDINDAFIKADDAAQSSAAYVRTVQKLQDADDDVRLNSTPAQAAAEFSARFTKILDKEKVGLSTNAFADFNGKISTKFLTSRASIVKFSRKRQADAVVLGVQEVGRSAVTSASRPEVYGNTVVYKQALDAVLQVTEQGIAVGAVRADEGGKQFAAVRKDMRLRAIRAFLETLPADTMTIKMLETGDFNLAAMDSDDFNTIDNIERLYAELTPKERIDLRRSTIRAFNERSRIADDKEREADDMVKAEADSLLVKFYTEDGEIARGVLLDEMEIFAGEKGFITAAQLKAAQDYQTSSIRGSLRDDEAVARNLRLGLLTGVMDQTDVERAYSLLTPETIATLTTLASSVRDKQFREGVGIIKLAFGLFENQAVFSREQRVAAEMATNAILEFTRAADPRKTAGQRVNLLDIANKIADSGGGRWSARRKTNARNEVEVQLRGKLVSVDGLPWTDEKALRTELRKRLVAQELSSSDLAKVMRLIDAQITTVFGDN